MHIDTLVRLLIDIFGDDLYAEDIDHHLEQYLFKIEKKVFLSLIVSSIPGDVLCPNIPFIKEGSRILPPISDPTANGAPAAETMQPAPPELPPTILVKSYGLFVVP